MKDKRHKRKESYSVLIISNLDRKSRRFHMARSAPYLLLFLVLLICAAAAGLAYRFTARELEIKKLTEQLHNQEKMVQSWETEKSKLENRNAELETEIDTLEQALKLNLYQQEEITVAAEPPEEPTKAEDESSDVPSLYPASVTGKMAEQFSDEHPYITITLENNCDVTAAGDGTVTSVGSDDTHSCVIAIKHENGYVTRYLYDSEVSVSVAEGDSVHGGDTLFTITEDGTELDYYVLYNDEPMNPVLIIEAKG